ncbi:MAG: hypothetical protein IJ183_06585 [Prevotella sp.]|nr:hypothetical protein [Prevotella sp.]MBQ9560668.1 hypothetical protein [Prevotella sp.]
MRITHYIYIILTAGIAFASCGNKQENGNAPVTSEEEKPLVADSALYGTVGRGTAMHSVELLDENGNATVALVNVDIEADVQGGIYCDDRLTMVLDTNKDGDKEVRKAINLTSLCGRWVALDRNFEIMEDGTVISLQSQETNPYTEWSMVNCNLVLNRDTFEVDYLGPDSLALENDKGIFVYKRFN